MQTAGTGAVDGGEPCIKAECFKGDMIMYATRPALQLTGFVKLDIKKIKNHTPDKVLINGDERCTDRLAQRAYGRWKTVNAGLHVGTDNNGLIAFLNDKKSDDDGSSCQRVL
jgi:hypothetical protein